MLHSECYAKHYTRTQKITIVHFDERCILLYSQPHATHGQSCRDVSHTRTAVMSQRVHQTRHRLRRLLSAWHLNRCAVTE